MFCFAELHDFAVKYIKNLYEFYGLQKTGIT